MFLDSNKINFLGNTLDQEKQKFEKILNTEPINYEDAFFCLNNIIDYKNLVNYKGSDSIYIDFKKLIVLYIKSSESKELGYDEIDVSMIDKKLDKLAVDEKLLILDMFKRELLKNSFSSKVHECNKFIDIAKLKLYKKKKGFKNRIKYLFLLSSSGFHALLLSLLILFVLIFIIFLPAPFAFMETINIENADFSSYSIINKVANILSLLFDLDHKMKIEASNILGVILLGALKLIFISIIINYLWKKIVEYFKLID